MKHIHSVDPDQEPKHIHYTDPDKKYDEYQTRDELMDEGDWE